MGILGAYPRELDGCGPPARILRVPAEFVAPIPRSTNRRGERRRSNHRESRNSSALRLSTGTYSGQQKGPASRVLIFAVDGGLQFRVGTAVRNLEMRDWPGWGPVAMSESMDLRKANAPAAAWTAFIVLVVVIGAIYVRAPRAGFVHDDNTSVLNNASIVRLRPLLGTADSPGPLTPPRDAVTSGRPLVNLSLALNYRLGGYDTLGYHIVNIVIHVFSSILLYGLVRRTLKLDCFRGRFGRASAQLGLVVGLVWAIHPLQSDSVEYVSQRTESMMGLFYLATLYASLRYFSAQTRPVKVAAGTAAT